MKHVFIYMAALLFLLPQSYGQFEFDNYQQLTVVDGAPGTLVLAFVEDKHGFIWAGSWTGLARFDGSKFDRIVRLPSDSVFLPSHYITALMMDGDSLWIGTSNGLSILNIPERIFSNHTFKTEVHGVTDEEKDRNYIVNITKDRQGNIWITPRFEGFVKWDRKTKNFTHFRLPYAPNLADAYGILGQTTLAQIIQDQKHDSILWAGAYGGLVRLNQQTGAIKRIIFDQADEQTNFNVNRKICIYQDLDGLIYSGSWSSGLSVYDPKNGEYQYVNPKFKKNATAGKGVDHLYTIFPGPPGYLYLTYAREYGIFNKESQTYQTIKKNILKGKTTSFGIDFIDSQGRIWFGRNNGIMVSDPVMQQFDWHSLAELNSTPIELIPRQIVEDFYPGYISVASQYADGLYHFNPQTGHKFEQSGAHIMKDDIYFHSWGITQSNQNQLVFAENKKLYTLIRGSNEIKPYDFQVPITYGGVRNMLTDSFGRIWITSHAGLFSIDPSNSQVHSYENSKIFEWIRRPFLDSKGNIWITGFRGHLVYSHTQNQLLTFEYIKDSSLTYVYPRQFCECPNGEVWLAGDKEGIGLLSKDEPQKGVIRKIQIRSENGRPVPIYRLACNQKNELWASDQGGILRINRDDWSIEKYHRDYGVQSFKDLDVFQFLKNGELIFNGRDGFYTVDPNKLKINTRLPRPYVVSVSSNKGRKNKLQDHLEMLPVNLEPEENVVTITFSAINHTLAKKTRFRYMLEGVDEDWIDPGDKRTFTYAYLEGGNYIFKVKAANNEGIWNPEVYKLPIIVGTPWYKTSLFWIVLTLLLFSFAYAYYKDRIRQVERESGLKAEFEKKVADLEMRALRAQMNPHFIFNCLNSIDAYIIKNDTRKASEYLNNFSRLVRLILQHSRSAYVNLKDELEALELYLKLEQMRFRNSFEYEILLKNHLTPENYEIPPMLIQPFVENAIWHGLNYKENAGRVTIEIHVEGDLLVCIIEDNGIGREASAAIRASKKVKRKSMGMGITTERIELINNMYQTNNEVEIQDLYDESGNANGTRVVLQIPL